MTWDTQSVTHDAKFVTQDIKLAMKGEKKVE